MIKKLFSKYRLAIWGISIYDAKGPFHITNKRDKKNPVLTYKDVTDCDAQFIADPFMIKYEDLWYMFFEIYDEARQTGVIVMIGNTIKLYSKKIFTYLIHMSLNIMGKSI